MTLYIEDDYNFFEKEEGLLEKVQKVVEKVVEEEKVPFKVEISLTVVEKDEIQAINLEHRQKDQPTDVLSFPQIEPVSNGVILWDELELVSLMNRDTDELILGDIVLCHEIAKEQASRFDHSLEREVCFLVAHSMFHLLGYDHMNEEDEKQMIEKQEKVLNLLSIVR